MAVSKEKTSLMSKPYADLLTKIAELNCMTAAHQKAFEALAESVQTTEVAKSKAKQNYNEQLDLGDADEMQKCLDRIKATNEEIKSLGDQMKSYGPKVMELHKVQASLIDQARQESKTAEEAVKKAKRQFVDAESVVNAAMASAGLIGILENTIANKSLKK